MVVYIGHPSNYDAEENYSIAFAAPPDGEGFGLGADAYFAQDARKVARLMAWMSYTGWFREFIAQAQLAYDEMEADADMVQWETLEDFVGEQIERCDLERTEIFQRKAS